MNYRFSMPGPSIRNMMYLTAFTEVNKQYKKVRPVDPIIGSRICPSKQMIITTIIHLIWN